MIIESRRDPERKVLVVAEARKGRAPKVELGFEPLSVGPQAQCFFQRPLMAHWSIATKSLLPPLIELCILMPVMV